MKESHECEITTHIGPESCGAAREGGVEALTVGTCGPGIEPRKNLAPGVPCGHRPRARTETPRAGTGRSRVRPEQKSPWDASGSLRTYADDERTWEVGQP